MNANQQIFPIGDIAFNQSNMVLAIELIDVSVCTEVAILGGHLGISHTPLRVCRVSCDNLEVP